MTEVFMSTLDATCPPLSQIASRPRLALSSPDDREQIYRIRYEVYAEELGQHLPNSQKRLTDRLDAFNEYIVAREGDYVWGFVSITPPGEGGYSVDKYVPPDELPFIRDAGLFEVRLLTVAPDARRTKLAAALMYAALRYVEAHGGTRIVAIGRREVLDLYRRAGLHLLGREIVSGAVRFELMSATVAELRDHLAADEAALRRVIDFCDWRLPMPAMPPALCFHGGESIREMGRDFGDLGRRDQIVNADVLDAWFPPASRVVEAIAGALPWLVRTSPPAGCEGMLEAIARLRGVPDESLVAGAGSSDMIFRALRHWFDESSNVLLPDPTYGEYAHLFLKVIGCRVRRLKLSRTDDYALDLAELRDEINRRNYNLVVIVNPNSPTGRHTWRDELEDWLRTVPPFMRVWIDEAYVDYVGADQSLERFAAASENVIVCKTMSKVYALSGMRAAYLCGPASLMAEIRAITPPWIVGLPAQLAVVRALEELAYYQMQYHRTHALRSELASALEEIGLHVVKGATANFLLIHLPESGLDAASVVKSCQSRGVYLRDASAMGRTLGRRAIRIAVKDSAQNHAIVAALAAAWRSPAAS
jgi:histidinol-phosphate/aromatic aminotransferase/cobyric acid decarboxylase-like protein/GNAT superfamily N-acetyltransferase